MIKNSKFSYSKDDVTIIFLELPRQEHTKNTHYEFEVSDDPALTEKLKASVKKTRVTFSSIPFCAEALFAIIKNNAFETLITTEEHDALYQDYLEEYGIPELDIFELESETKGIPQWKVILVHGGGEDCSAISRTVKNATGLVLKEFFEKNPH